MAWMLHLGQGGPQQGFGLFHDLGDQKLTERYYADAAVASLRWCK